MSCDSKYKDNRLMDTLVTAPPKSVQVAEILRREISKQRLQKGARLQPARVLAARFAVSKQVIQSSFAILEREGVIESHVGRGTFVAPPAKSIATRTVLLLLCGTADKHDRLPSMLPSALQKHGYIPYVFDVAHSCEPATIANIKALLAERPRACVVTTYSNFNFDLLEWVAPETQLVLVRHFEGTKDYQASYIMEDYVEAGRQAGNYLVEKGRRKIATVSFPREPGWTSDRMITGLEQGLAARGMKVFKYLDGDLDDAAFNREFAKGGFPDGIFCILDHYYRIVRRTAARHGLILERDFDAIGYGNTPWATAFGIASFDTREDLLAEKVAEVLQSGENVKQIILPVLRLHHGEHDSHV